VRRALAAVVLAAAAASIPGAAAGRGIGLSASPLRVTLRGSSSSVITVRNPGTRTLRVAVSRAGLARSLRGRPRMRPARGAVTWIRIHPRRFRIAPNAKTALHVVAVLPRRAAPGDHPAVLLLTTRPVGLRRVQLRLRVGVIVDLRVRGRLVRRLEARSLTVRRAGPRRKLELLLVNRGNVSERLDADRLRLVLIRHGRVFAELQPRRQEILPRSRGVAEFAYDGPLRGGVFARLEASPAVRVPRRMFHLRL